jgi:hypothetical protein
MRFEFESYAEKCKRLNQWQNWFAWYPVFLTHSDKPTLVWFETVQRIKDTPFTKWRYRERPSDIDFEVHP